MIRVDILDLQGIYNTDNKDQMILAFPRHRITVTKDKLQGIALWLRANKAIGGYYPLDLGGITINAARPYHNHHETHIGRLDVALGRFRPWCNINKELIIEENKFHEKGIVRLRHNTNIRIFRNKDFDYILEIKEFVKVVQEM